MIRHSEPFLGQLEAEAAERAVLEGFVGHGPRARELELAVAGWTGRSAAFGVTSGFHALVIALRALDLPKGARIGIPAMTCGSLLSAVRTVGYSPVLVDIGRDLNLSVAGAAACRLDGLVAPHAYGAPLDIAGVQGLGVPWVEDCATAPATESAGVRAGASGTCAIYSFGSTKFVTGGGGGMVLGCGAPLSVKLEDLLSADRAIPKGEWAHQPALAWPGRMGDLSAAVALEQWRRKTEFALRRMALAEVYESELGGIDGVDLPARVAGHSFYRYVIRTEGASEQLARWLKEHGVDARAGVNPWLEDFAGVAEWGGGEGVRWWRGHLLSMPIHFQLSEAEVREAARLLKKGIKTL